jgi:hypothetical protein
VKKDINQSDHVGDHEYCYDMKVNNTNLFCFKQTTASVYFRVTKLPSNLANIYPIP